MSDKTILIVDDDDDLRRGLGIRLKASKYRVVVAADAISAVMTARKEKPDLVVLDLGLPGGDGFVVMQRLEAISSVAIPVIVLSGRDPSVNKERALRAGAAAFLQKPADNDELLNAIRNALGETSEAATEADSLRLATA